MAAQSPEENPGLAEVEAAGEWLLEDV